MSELVSENLKAVQKCQNKSYDQNAREPGEVVLVLLPTSSSKLSTKFKSLRQ